MNGRLPARGSCHARLASIAFVASAISDLKLHSSGKVREIYEWEDDLLMVASDRISIYDVVMPTPIPDKGKVLNRISEFWFELTGDIVPNHFLSADVPEEAIERGMRVRRLEMYPVECVVRGYLSGSGWKEYKAGGAVCGIELPSGLLESDRLPEPIFTPATKAEIGDHDENVDFDRAAEIVGDRALMEELRRISIEVYQRGADHAAERGIILADTKFELGATAGADIVLGDEVLTPDSSSQSRTYCLSKEAWPRPGSQSSAGQKRDESGVSTSSPRTTSAPGEDPNSNFVSAIMIPRSAA